MVPWLKAEAYTIYIEEKNLNPVALLQIMLIIYSPLLWCDVGYADQLEKHEM